MELEQWQGLVLQTFFTVAETYLPPTATLGAWAPMSPAQVDPGSPLMIPGGNRRLRPKKKEDIQKEEWVPTLRPSSPFLREHVEKDVISGYRRKNRTR